MSKVFLLISMTLFLSSCYTETQKPDYKFMNKIKELSQLDSSLLTTVILLPKKHYYGKVKHTDKLMGSFYIKNSGEIDFNIFSIKSNCDCIQVEYTDTKTIHANDSLLVKYQMQTKNLSGKFQNTIIAIGNCKNGNQTYYFEGSFY